MFVFYEYICEYIWIDSVCQKSNFILLSETSLPDKESAQLPNFNCIAKLKIQNGKAGGVIYENLNISFINALNIDLIYEMLQAFFLVKHSGRLCASKIIVKMKELLCIFHLVTKSVISFHFYTRDYFVYSLRDSMILNWKEIKRDCERKKRMI